MHLLHNTCGHTVDTVRVRANVCVEIYLRSTAMDMPLRMLGGMPRRLTLVHCIAVRPEIHGARLLKAETETETETEMLRLRLR